MVGLFSPLVERIRATGAILTVIGLAGLVGCGLGLVAAKLLGL